MLEADLQRFYGVDLVDLWRGRLSARRLWVLVEYLPPESTAARLLSGVPDELRWLSFADVLLARAVDELAALRWEWELAHIDPKKHRPRKQPESVMPRADRPERDATVVPLVSPHRLGGFIERGEEGITDGN